MSESTSVARLAHQIITGVFKILIPDLAARFEGMADIANALADGKSQVRSRQTLARHLEEAAASLGERLERMAEIEFPLPDEKQRRSAALAERDLAVGAIARVVAGMQSAVMEQIRRGLSVEELARQLEPHARAYWRTDQLSEPAVEFGRAFLTEVCDYLVRLVRRQPDFDRHVALDSYLLTQRILELLEAGMETMVLPRYREGTPREHSRFEAKYLSGIIDAFQNMELFGIDIPPELRRQPIDVAYISLEASHLEAPAPLGRAWHSVTSAKVLTRRIQRVDEAFGEIARHGQFFPTGARILITGEAGSGKTTVVHWLALRAASRKFPEALETWGDCIPFVVQLRYLFRGATRAYPSDRDLIKVSAGRDAAVPGGWLDSVLHSGKALIMFDGLDELSQLHRGDAETWLTKLMREYPAANFLVTSRTEAVKSDWFKARSFTHLTLEPMSMDDVERCIKAWFNAIVPVVPRASRASYRESEQHLLRELHYQRSLQQLVENPLLCAMLCAFYAARYESDDSAPSTQAELYEIVLGALIHERDYKRKALDAAPENLPGMHKRLLLQAIARHMNDCNLATIACTGKLAELEYTRQNDASVTTALDIIEERRAEITTALFDSREALRHLLERSIVFSEVGRNEAQFAHRTFQEYLAASDYAGDNAVDTLLRHATDPAWRRTIVFAAHEARKDMSSNLVSGLLEKAERNPQTRRDLLTLVAECLTASDRIDPQVSDRAKQMMEHIVPPRSLREADLFTPFGEGVVPWLAKHEKKGEFIVAACVRAAARIGGASALKVIADYSKCSPKGEAVTELLAAWSSFEPREYAEQVINNIDFTGIEVELTSDLPLEAVGHATSLRHVRLKVARDSAPFADFRSWRNLTRLEAFDVGGYWRLRSLDGIERLTGLQRLNISDSVGITDAAPLAHLSGLRELYLAGCTGLADFTPVAALNKLRVLVLERCRGADWGWLAELPELLTLSLAGCDVESAQFVGNLKQLRLLRLSPHAGLACAVPLEECTDLRRLELAIAPDNTNALRFAPEARLVHLSVARARAMDIAALAQTPSLRTLRLSGLSGVRDLGGLASLTELTTLNLKDCINLRSGAGIENMGELRELDLSGTDIEDVDFAASLTNLRKVTLDDCRQLRDLSGLRNLKQLRNLSVMRSPLVNAERQSTLWESRHWLSIASDIDDEEEYDYGPHA